MKNLAILAEIDTQRQQLSDTLRIFEDFVGAKNYELSNHLGNVLATISDKTIFNTDHYNGIIYSAQLYYPFGWEIPTLSYSAKSYRYGFNGVEKAREIGEGVNTTFYREQDTRAGRWWSFDPRPNAAVSPYAMMENNPIAFSDVLGDTIKYKNRDTKTTYDALVQHGKNLKNSPYAAKDAKAAATAMLSEFDELEKSTVNYELNLQARKETDKETTGGFFGVDIEDPKFNTFKIVIILEPNQYIQDSKDLFMSKMAHELKHAFQYEKGMLAFSNNGQPIFYDRYDEVEAYQRQIDLGLPHQQFTKIMTAKKVGEMPSYHALGSIPEGINDYAPQIQDSPQQTFLERFKTINKNRSSKGQTPRMIYKGWQDDLK